MHVGQEEKKHMMYGRINFMDIFSVKFKLNDNN